MDDLRFTDQDRKDVQAVLTAVLARTLEEFTLSGTMEVMYRPFAELIVRVALAGDEQFANVLPEDPDDYSLDDFREFELSKACKRILASGRFDFYQEV